MKNLKLITHVNNLKKKKLIKTQLNYIKNTVFVKKVDSKIFILLTNRKISQKALKAI